MNIYAFAILFSVVFFGTMTIMRLWAWEFMPLILWLLVGSLALSAGFAVVAG